MKKTTVMAAVLAASIMFSACAANTNTHVRTETEETTQETTEPAKEPNLIGNPDFSSATEHGVMKSLDVENSWIEEVWGIESLIEWVSYAPVVSGSELTIQLMINDKTSTGDTIKLYLFEKNDAYEWNTEDAYASFEGTACNVYNGHEYWCKTVLPEGMPTATYTLVIVRPDGTVDSMKDFDIVATTEEANSSECVDKPVIYLYPEESTEVYVDIEFEGELQCTYPQYDPEFGWHVTADPDGRLHNLNDGRDYDYLFWEGKTFEDLKSFNNSICVKGSDTAAFLEEYLEAAGLNASEIDDFVSFWLPKMQNNNYNIISFLGTEYTDVAKLNVYPAPDTEIRVFMVFAPLDEAVEIPSEKQLVMPENTVRDGFTLVEWGGSQVTFEG